MKSIRIIPLQKPVETEVAVPGSKSYTNRALILAALTPGKIVLENPLFSGDTCTMIQCLTALGIRVYTRPGSIEVAGLIEDAKEGNYELDANLSGTTIRFILALSTLTHRVKVIKGKKELMERPIGELVSVLRELGAEIEYLEKEGFPPLRVTSRYLSPRTTRLSGGVSSQYFSALLMVALRVGDVVVEVTGEQISKPYIDMTISSMWAFGVPVENDGYRRYRVPGGQCYHAERYEVEGDYSSAGYFFALAALTRSTIIVKSLNPESAQADRRILDVLRDMGSGVIKGKDDIAVVRKGVRPLRANVINFPDQAQTLAVLAVFAEGESAISGIRSLRVKETDRVSETVAELGKMGIEAKATDTMLVVRGGTLPGELRDVLEELDALYCEAADAVVSTDDRDAEKVADAIVREIN